MNTTPQTVEEYIASFPKNTQEILRKIRTIVLRIRPEAEEKMGYGIPTYKVNGKNALHFAGYENHIGLYPGPSVLVQFSDKLQNFETSKGTIRFPLSKPIPYDLIEEIASYSLKKYE